MEEDIEWSIYVQDVGHTRVHIVLCNSSPDLDSAVDSRCRVTLSENNSVRGVKVVDQD